MGYEASEVRFMSVTHRAPGWGRFLQSYFGIIREALAADP